ncbi:MAG: hypothetical protein NTZ93_04760 [Candidatus Beckwithbacteria bacterium]|nr:hypothetical protein [Candidatus Beckwithbacteria bacterium]
MTNADKAFLNMSMPLGEGIRARTEARLNRPLVRNADETSIQGQVDQLQVQDFVAFAIDHLLSLNGPETTVDRLKKTDPQTARELIKQETRENWSLILDGKPNKKALARYGAITLVSLTGLAVLAACLGRSPTPGGGGSTATATPDLCSNLLHAATIYSAQVEQAVVITPDALVNTAALNQQLVCYDSHLTATAILPDADGIANGGAILSLAVAGVDSNNQPTLTGYLGVELKPVDIDNNGQLEAPIMVVDPDGVRWQDNGGSQLIATLPQVAVNAQTGQLEPTGDMVRITADKTDNGINFALTAGDQQITIANDQLRSLGAGLQLAENARAIIEARAQLAAEFVAGVSPEQFLNGEAIQNGFTLPDDVRALARANHLAPIQDENKIVGWVPTAGELSVMLTDHLVSGAKLMQMDDGRVTYSFDGQPGSIAVHDFPVIEGVGGAAFVAQKDNPWGLKEGTVVVWFFTGGGKAPSVVLNQDVPLRIMVDAPNKISVAQTPNGLTLTSTDQAGLEIEKQKVEFLPPLPPEFLAQLSGTNFSYESGNLVYTTPDGEKITIPGMFYTGGLSVDLGRGKVIIVPFDELVDRVKIGQGDILQIYDQKGEIVGFFDWKNEVWVDIVTLRPDFESMTDDQLLSETQRLGEFFAKQIDCTAGLEGLLVSTQAPERVTGGNYTWEAEYLGVWQMPLTNEDGLPVGHINCLYFGAPGDSVANRQVFAVWGGGKLWGEILPFGADTNLFGVPQMVYGYETVNPEYINTLLQPGTMYKLLMTPKRDTWSNKNHEEKIVETKRPVNRGFGWINGPVVFRMTEALIKRLVADPSQIGIFNNPAVPDPAYIKPGSK